MKKTGFSAKAALVWLGLVSSPAGFGQVVELIETDGLETQTLNASVIDGWVFQDVGFSDPDCTAFMYVYPDNPGQVATENRNYFTVARNAGGGPDSTEAYTEYSRVGLSDQPIEGSLSLNVYATGASNDAAVGCHRSTLFKTTNTTELAARGITPESGNFKINAKVMMNPFSQVRELAEGHKVGVALVIINNEVTPSADNGWGIMVNTTREVALAGDVVTVAEDFEIDLGAVQDITIRAGVYNQTVYQQYDGTFWDDFSLTVGDLTEEQLAEIAACEDTSTIRFDEAFGTGAETTCLTDTYELADGAQSFAGFADGRASDGANRDNSLYPFSFPFGGEISFDCTSVPAGDEAAQRVRFKFEKDGYPDTDPSFFTEWVECPVEGLSQIGGLSRGDQGAGTADDHAMHTVVFPRKAENAGTRYNNLLMYLETPGAAPVQVTNVSITAYTTYEESQRYRDRRTNSAEEPIPVMPLGGLFGLIGLMAWLGLRRR